MSTYLWINLLSISIPFAFTFHPKIQFYKRWNALWPAIIFPAIFFIIWDIYFTDLKVWGFNPQHLTGINIFNLPIEEIIFFIAIPYASMFTYDVIRNLKIIIKTYYIKNILLSISLVLLILAILNIDKIYTSVTFFFTALFLLMHIWWFKSSYLNVFFISYLVIYLFPFLIVNGILTGSIISEPVVWYDNTQNLGIRILTIPIEDFIYGFLLYITNVTIYEKLLSRKNYTQLFVNN